MGRAILATGVSEGCRVLNVGSSTGAFRAREQPWVDAEVFGPLRARGIEVVHLDLKVAAGVDLVGDVLDPTFRAGLEGGWDVVISSNLLEHLADRTPFLTVLPQLTRPGGWLVVTVPRRFPRHPDPIDTMYRPSPDQLVGDMRASAAQTLRVVEAVEVADARHWTYWAHYTRLRGRAPLTGLAGLLARSWTRSERRAELASLPVRTSATCVLVQVAGAER
jgi:SAM-dependent methyltransferase